MMSVLGDIAAFIGVFGAAVGGGFALIWALVYAYYRYNRRRVRRSARAIAAAFGLSPRASEDPRMEIYEGVSLDHRVHVATHAGWTAGDEGPVFRFQRHPAVAILVRFATPLAADFRLTTVHMAPRTLRTGDPDFDQWFKVQAGNADYAAQMLAPPGIRDALMRLYGPEKDPNGSGIVIEVDPSMLALRYSEPRPAKAVEVARAALTAVARLSQRTGFIRT